MPEEDKKVVEICRGGVERKIPNVRNIASLTLTLTYKLFLFSFISRTLSGATDGATTSV